MKKWNTPELSELNINETAHDWLGIYRDGGYIGDGEISGHLGWEKPESGNGNNGGNNSSGNEGNNNETDFAS